MIESVTKTLASWVQEKHLYIPIIEKLEALGSEPAYNGYLYASLTGNRDTILGAIRALRSCGLKSKEHPKEGQPSFQAWYENADQTVRVYLNFSSTVCRRVKTGTRTEIVDVYEVQCGDDPVPEQDVPGSPEDPAETQLDVQVKNPDDDIPF